jgi:hypothetical protein
MKFALPLIALLLIAGCGLFGSDAPVKMSGDADGVVIRGGSDSDRKDMGAIHCGSFGKSAVLLPREQEDSSSVARFRCR